MLKNLFELKGLSQNTIEKYKLGYDPNFEIEKNVFAEVAIIPNKEESKILIIENSSTKEIEYLKIGVNNLYLEDNLNLSQTPIFVVESELDALSIIEAGGSAIALGCKSNLIKLIDLIKEKPPIRPLILAFENDKIGKDFSYYVLRELKKSKVELKAQVKNIYGDFNNANEILNKDRQMLEKEIKKINNEYLDYIEFKQNIYKKQSSKYCVDKYIDKIKNGNYDCCVSTGFTILDETLGGGLKSNLYIIGAASSIGKTTLVTQIADEVAKQGKDVLIFSLEMGECDIIIKSLSRLTYINNNKNALSHNEIYDKNYDENKAKIVNEACQLYSSFSNHLYIKDHEIGLTAKGVYDKVKAHIEITGNIPIVIIDYIQIMTPIHNNSTDKQNIDQSVTILKQISKDFNVPVIGISAVNRASYHEKISMESFKDSGSIEYSSDVLIGMQFENMDSKGFDINKEKSKEIRNIKLVILKNRMGKTGIDLSFEYNPKYNYFEEVQRL